MVHIQSFYIKETEISKSVTIVDKINVLSYTVRINTLSYMIHVLLFSYSFNRKLMDKPTSLTIIPRYR